MSIPMTQVDPDAHESPDVDSAARDMIGRLNVDDKNEQAGLLLVSPDGKYTSTLPVSQNHHDDFTLQMQLKKGWKVAGVFHTHPSAGKHDTDANYFSPGDLDTATKFKVPSYILFLGDRSVRKYVPGKSETSEIFGPKGKLTVAKGDELPPEVQKALEASPSPELAPEVQKALDVPDGIQPKS